MNDGAVSDVHSYTSAVHAALKDTGIFIANLSGATKSDFLDWLARIFPEATTTLFAVTPQEACPYRSLTRAALPFHNDGVYLKWPPRYVALFCEERSTAGGATTFVRGDLIAQELNKISPSLFLKLKDEPVCTKLGDFEFIRELIVRHPCIDADVLFFMDPRLAPDIANITFSSEDPLFNPDAVIDCIRGAISTQSKYFQKQWFESDVVIFDNFLLLHARESFSGARRLLRADVRYKSVAN